MTMTPVVPTIVYLLCSAVCGAGIALSAVSLISFSPDESTSRFLAILGIALVGVALLALAALAFCRVIAARKTRG
jgi:membrane protein DedA with SNARE-associated domain